MHLREHKAYTETLERKRQRATDAVVDLNRFLEEGKEKAAKLARIVRMELVDEA